MSWALFRTIILVLLTLTLARSSEGVWIETNKLTASDPVENAWFGQDAAISGNVAIVGANGHNAAYLFDIATGQELAKFKVSTNAHFGACVDIDGNTAIVGAPMSGTAYLFDVETRTRRFTLSGSGGYFGQGVAISGNVAVVGEWNKRSVYVFDVISGQRLRKWTGSSGFGGSVDISGNSVIVGESSTNSAYVIDLTDESRLKLTAAESVDGDIFGDCVAISDGVAIVGAPWSNHAGDRSGSAYLFDVSTGEELFRLTASDAAAQDQFGRRVAISENVAIVGAEGNNAAYLFDVRTGKQICKLTGSDTGSGDHFGMVAISENVAIVGAPEDATPYYRSGSAYVFIVPEPSSQVLLGTMILLVASGLARGRVRCMRASLLVWPAEWLRRVRRVCPTIGRVGW